MAVTTKKTFPATSNSTTTTFGPIGIELNNQDDLDVYITESGGTRVLQYKQSSASTTDSNHPQVNDTTGLYFPPVAAGVALKNYTISADNNNVIFNSALPSGAVVSVERRTRDSSSSYTSFSSGSTIRSTDLNTAFDEARFTAQEGRNKAFDLERQTFSEDGNIRLLEDQSLIYEGATDDAHETKLAITDPTADRTITFPDVSGNVVTTGDTGTVTSTMLLDGTIVNADINASAAIAGSKLAASTTSAPGSMSAADKTKLDGIETGATADQTNAEIRAAVEAASDSNVFTDADHTKLNAIEASADVTDATNVDAAGAVMNSDLDVKGEILVGDGSGDPTALSVGTNDHVLTADSSTATGVAWKAASGGGGTAITIQDEGSALSTAASTINFVGSGVTASGTGTTKTITISGGGGGAVTTDFQFLELKAHNNTSGAFSAGAHDYELVTKGTTTAVTPQQAAALLISIGGVIQQPQPNQGDIGAAGNGSDGFAVDGSSIHFGANLTAHPDFIIWLKGSGVATVSANSITGDKIALGSDASGDIMYYNGTDYVRLAKGSDGEVLKLASGVPSWAADAGGMSNIVEDTSPQLGGALDVQAQEINTSTTNGNIKLTPNGTGLLEVKGNTNPGTIQLNCENNSHGVKIKGPAHSAAASYTLTLPNDDGSANEVLKTDGSGNLSWVAQTADTNTQLTTEQVEDIVGGMLDGTETGISVTYDDTDGNIDFVVGTLNQDTTGTAAIATTVTVADESSDTTCFPLFATAATGNLGPKSGSNLTFNSSTGALGATSFTGDGSALTNLPAGIGDIIEHKNALSANKTIGTNNNALVAGPFSTGSYTLTIPSGSVFTVV